MIMRLCKLTLLERQKIDTIMFNSFYINYQLIHVNVACCNEHMEVIHEGLFKLPKFLYEDR